MPTKEKANPHALTIEVKGEVVSSNFDTYAAKLRKALEVASRVNPKTDEDFGWCEGAVKEFKAQEEMMTKAEEDALRQADTIYAALTQVRDLRGETSAQRLRLAKLVKDRKDEIRSEIIEDGLAEVECADHLRTKFRAEVESGVKGRRTLETMRQGVSQVVAVINGRLTATKTVIDQFQATHGADLIPDRDELELKGSEVVGNELRRRLEAKELRDREAKAKAEAEAARKDAEEARREAVEASKPPAAPKPQAEAPKPSAPAQEPTGEEVSESVEWKSFMDTLSTAFAPVKAARAALKHPANVERAERIALGFTETLRNTRP